MRAWDVLLRVLGLRRKKPTTRLGRALRWSEHGITLLAGVYLFLALFPQVLLAHSFSAQGVCLLSSQEVPAQAQALVGQVRAKIERSGLYRQGDRFTLCLCNNRVLYTFFTPKNAHAFAAANALTGKIFVAEADVEQNRCRAHRADYNERSFVGVATHEIGHRLLCRRFGLIRYIRTPRWIKEGYAEYLAGESSFPEEQGDQLLAQGCCAGPGPFNYFLYRRMVQYLIEEEGLSIEGIVVRQPIQQQVMQKTCQWVKTRVNAETVVPVAPR